MTFTVAITDSPATPDVAIEREVLKPHTVRYVPWHGQQPIPPDILESDAILCMHARISQQNIAALVRCSAIVRYGTGLDNIDLSAARAAGIQVSGVKDYCTEEVANHTIALLLTWFRRLPEYSAMVRDGLWNQRPDTTGNWGYRIERLSQLQLGLIGFGSIGRAVAARARALGMHVVAYSPSLTASDAREHKAELRSFEEVLRTSNVVSLHLPLTAATRKIIDAHAISLMRRGAVLINTSRGGLIDEPWLREALNDGRLGGALLDVFEVSPLPLEHPLRHCPNVLLTPHVAFYSEGSLNDLRRRAAATVHTLLGGQTKEQ